MVEYFVYGYKLKSNKEFNMLTPYKDQNSQGEIKMQIYINDLWNKDIVNQNIQVDYKEDDILLKIGRMVAYKISPTENLILVWATDFAWVESTFLNLPFALFFSHKNMLLLHASSLIINDTVVPLCAPKGTGKTTVSVGLSKFYKFYSDDTLLLKMEKDRVLGFYGTKQVKLHKDSYNALIPDGNFELLSKNLQGKAYVGVKKNAEIDLVPGQLKKLFFLQREGKNVSVEKITSGFNKKMLLHTNICGSGILGYNYCKDIEKNLLFKNITENLDFLKITVRDSREQLERTVGEIKQIIDDSINPAYEEEGRNGC